MGLTPGRYYRRYAVLNLLGFFIALHISLHR